MADLKTRIKELRDSRGLSQQEFGAKIGIGKSTVANYESGTRKPKYETLEAIADYFNVDMDYLYGKSDIPNRLLFSDKVDIYKLDNIFPISTQKIPLLGKIACGEPIYADEDRESYIIAGTDIKADFCLQCKGDSMINARILDGDIVFIREQKQVENGEIAAVQIENENTTDYEATLKRVYYYPDKGILILRAENPKYEDFVFSKDEINKVHILGKAIAFQSDIN